MIRNHSLRSVKLTDSTSCKVWTGVRRTETNLEPAGIAHRAECKETTLPEVEVSIEG